MTEEKIWLKNNGIKIVSLTEERLPDALKVMREAFYTDEPVAKGMKFSEFPKAVDDLEQLTIQTFKDGTSLVAIKKNQVVGAAFNKMQRKCEPGEEVFFDEFSNLNCKTTLAKEYINIMAWVDAQKDVFKQYKVDNLLEVMFLATSTTCRRQGVGLLLVKAAIEVARSRGIPLCTAVFTSKGSQRIGAILEWDHLITAKVADFQFQHQPYTKYPGENHNLKYMACRI